MPLFGDLVQIDGCGHHSFEDRGAYWTLLVFVDDRTAKLMELFVRTEMMGGSIEEVGGGACDLVRQSRRILRDLEGEGHVIIVRIGAELLN